MPKARKCTCDSENCYTCRNRHNWERWKGKRPRVEPPAVSDEELDRRALAMERRPKQWNA